MEKGGQDEGDRRESQGEKGKKGEEKMDSYTEEQNMAGKAENEKGLKEEWMTRPRCKRNGESMKE